MSAQKLNQTMSGSKVKQIHGGDERHGGNSNNRGVLAVPVGEVVETIDAEAHPGKGQDVDCGSAWRKVNE